MAQVIKDYVRSLRRVDRNLENATARFKEMEEDFHFTYDHTYIFDKQGKLIYISLLAARYLGFTPKQLERKYLRELNLPFCCEDFLEEEVKAVLTSGLPLSRSRKVTCHNGDNRYYDYIIKPLYNVNGVVCAVAWTARDVTKQKMLEREAYKQNQKFEKLIEMCPVGIVVTDCKAKVTMVNQAFLDGAPHLKSSDLIGKPYRVIAGIFNLKPKKAALYQALKGMEVRKNYLRRLDEHWLVSVTPLKEEDGSVIGAMSIFHNVTEHENWRREASRLDRLSLIGEMAAGVAHEIRNPMTVIRGYLQVFMNKATVGDKQKYQIVIEELDRVGLLISDFLSLARNRQTETAMANLNAIIGSVLPFVQSEALKNGVQLDVDLAVDALEQQLNEKEIKQLILNLVRNSLEAVKGRKGRISLQTANLGDKMELIIGDNGCGIPQSLLHRIFDPFFTTKDSGTGLGLSVCSSIVERHGGDMRVISEVDMGTEFSMVFPVAGCEVRDKSKKIS